MNKRFDCRNQRVAAFSGQARYHQLLWPANKQGISPFEPAFVDDDPLETCGEAGQRRFEFNSRQRRTQAEMDAQPEAKGAPVRTCQVEAIRF